MRRVRVVILAGAFLWCVAPHAVRVSARQCGGEERWPVKVGADASAATISSTPVATTLHNLIGLTRPTLPSDETTRLSQGANGANGRWPSRAFQA
jgi:hypothetical protein